MKMRGRDSEWGTVAGLLHEAAEGHGGIVLVEGEPGYGKSTMLGEARREATRLGLEVASGAGDELQRMLPLCPLLAAIGEFPEFGAPWGPERGIPDSRMLLIGVVQERLEKMAGGGPVLVVLDDLQHADSLTLLALRMLTRHLAPAPVAWLLASSAARGTAGLLFEALEEAGGTRISLGPLPDEAIGEYLVDTLGAVPEQSLLDLASGAGGNPLLITELLRGLDEEGALRIAAGRASLESDQMPHRVRDLIGRRVDTLGQLTRQMLEAAAVLGRQFAIEDVAEMLGLPTAALLSAVSEAVAAGIVTSDDEMLAFRHELVWRGVMESVPEPVASALHGQFGGILLDRGGAALPAAAHLLRGARPGKARVIDGLGQAANEVLHSSPQTAADLAMRALDLTGPGDPARAERSLTAVQALAAARRLPEAARLIQDTLATPLTAASRARLRSAFASVLSLSGQPDLARAEAEAVLAEPGLPGDLRDQARIALLRSLGMLPDRGEADRQARKILDDPGGSGNGVIAAALRVRAAVSWDKGQLAGSLALLREAVAEAEAGPPEDRPVEPHLELAARLAYIRELDEATALVNAAGRADARVGAQVALARALIGFADGRLDDAEAEAETARAENGDPGFWPAAGLAECVLGGIALRRGDLTTADRCARRAGDMSPEDRPGHTSGWQRFLAAMVAEARGEPSAVIMIGDMLDKISSYRWLLAGDPGIVPWLVRTCLAAGDLAHASAVAAESAAIARDNPEIAAATVPAVHACGLLRQGTGLLAQAAEEHPDAWARASAAEDLGVLLVRAGQREEAVRRFDAALGGYAGAGALRDVARVRRRLRAIGVRRRHWTTADRPVQGWDSLTETEREIAGLVAEGLTNRQVAVQMFVSAHTVAFHLRQIFRKLSIGSRAELAAVTTEQQFDRS